MTDWRTLHERLTTEQGRVNSKAPLLHVGRAALNILFFVVIALVEEKMEQP